MATQRQIEANRRNAKKSTGPKTPEGKAVSSRNARKRPAPLLRSTFVGHVYSAEHQQLAAEFFDEFQPANEMERFCVENLVHAEWFQRVCLKLETAIWNQGFREAGSTSLAAAYKLKSRELAAIDRNINAWQDRFFSALNRLTDLQVKRRKENRR